MGAFDLSNFGNRKTRNSGETSGAMMAPHHTAGSQKSSNPYCLIGGFAPLILDDPDAALPPSAAGFATSKAWDGAIGRHKKWNKLDVATRGTHFVFVQDIQGFWSEESPMSWLPASQLPDGHPQHPLKCCLPLLKQLRDLARLTQNDMPRAHEFLWKATATRDGGVRKGDLIGAEDVKEACWLVVADSAMKAMLQGQAAQQQQVQGGARIAGLSSGSCGDDAEMQDIDDPPIQPAQPTAPAAPSPHPQQALLHRPPFPPLVRMPPRGDGGVLLFEQWEVNNRAYVIERNAWGVFERRDLPPQYMRGDQVRLFPNQGLGR